MPPNGRFESQSFTMFSVNDNDHRIPMLISTKKNIVKKNLENFEEKSFFVLHIHIRSMSKNFESFREFLDSSCFSFSAICL